MKRTTLTLTTLMAALVLAGCSTARPPENVQLDLPAGYKEQATLDGAWKVAAPSDDKDKGAWWTVYGNEELNKLVVAATESNQNLAMALARVKDARALAGVVDADRGVQVNAGVGPTRTGNAQGASTTYRAPLSFSYEVDLFGRLSDASRAARLDAQGQEAAYRSVLLALQSDVAQLYFTIRSLDSEMDVLQKTIELRQEALNLAQRRYDAGDTSELDVAQAKTEWATTSAELEGVTRERAQRDHALALLLGKAPAEFSLPVASFSAPIVTVPAGLPSDLLERRPDIAQAQRQLAASSARIGAAKAAFFPKLVLTGAAGYESNELRDLFKWSSRSWILGPVVGTMLSMPILDGGRNRSNLARADANYEGMVANYRQQILIGFQDVEDNLSALRTLDRQLVFEEQAIGSAQLAARLADSRYRNGSASYFEVIDAQRSSLSSQRARIRSAGQRAVASVGLIRALGGGWTTDKAVAPLAQK
ncbi:efflux transporter outer membrane subunit [Oxalicibacterium faecigallinarum]|uniref:RND transporter n=1 Tax=Oxalicibacterium faecigallinarum TaxID=573741 RepID=A0A8J3ANY5_9BURK|nr:efflux transporter outer membrane subunit [Oxalicibacterium faecigallinarum]GGI17260.1 RND transporter [Oxalicibacterium faecigallinarum]